MQSTLPVILIVADHQETLAMYAIGLLSMGFQPVVAETVDVGFDRACQLRPDVVVADASLSGPSRLILMRRLRGDPRTRSAIIIALGDAGESAGHERGWDRCVGKPCPPNVLGVQILSLMVSRPVSRDR